MLRFIRNNHKLLFYIVWCLLNLIQAKYTELFDDEAYYWVYAQFPDWGYFDHPPLIALLIKAGYTIFPNELGVRFFIVLLNTATIFLVQQLLTRKDDLLFYAIAGSIALVQIGGIIAAPDLPLLFFVALFFVGYRRFTEKMTLLNSLLLGLTIDFMLYSKYHSVLIVLCTLCSNPKLFRHYQTWLVGGIALLAFAPHLYWQYLYEFPSIQFHLFERSATYYDIRFTLEYLAGQIVFAGPIIGWLLLKAAFGKKPATLTERALKFTLIGFYGFFLLSTFRGRVEANWTVPAFVGLIVLSHQYLSGRAALRMWLYKSLPASLVFVLLVRVYMLPVVPKISWFPKDEFHQNKVWVRAVQERAHGLPVVFVGSYQKASKYWFYSGQPSLSMNDIDYRRNNYNFWPLEDSLIGRKVMVVSAYDSLYNTDQIPALEGNASRIFQPYFSFSKIDICFVGKPMLEGKLLTIDGVVKSPVSYLSFFRQQPYDTAGVQLAFTDDNEKIHFIKTALSLQTFREAHHPFRITVPVNLPAGKYTCRFAINSCIPDKPSMNSIGVRILLQ
jgi:hypothetical protein